MNDTNMQRFKSSMGNDNFEPVSNQFRNRGRSWMKWSQEILM